jgi:hypothetical protein
MVLQKKESTTFSSVKPSNGSSFDMFGGMVLGSVGFTFSTGRAVTSFTGSYGRFLSYMILCTSLSKSRCSGSIFSVFVGFVQRGSNQNIIDIVC